MKEIKLVNSDKVCLVDDEDYEYLNKFIWKIDKNGYVYRNRLKIDPEGYPKTIYIHRVLMDAVLDGARIHVDHINHNTLLNSRNNIRKCTQKENLRNKSVNTIPTTNSSSKYKGVIYHKGKFRAGVHTDKRYISIGTFNDEIIAALAYDQVARIVWGEFAQPNFPDRFEEVVDIDYVLNKKKYQTSEYIGVQFDKKTNKWRVDLCINYKQIYIGMFDDEFIAAVERDKYLIENNLVNGYRKLNFPELLENQTV